MLHLHEEFQVLAGQVLIGREAVNPVIWPPGYVTTSRVVEVCVGIHIDYLHQDMQAQSKGKRSHFCLSQDKVFRLGG